MPDIPKAIVIIGHYAGTEKQANLAGKAFLQKLQALRRRSQNTTPIKTLYILETSPLLTVNRHTLINQVIQLCGGTNVFAASISNAPEVTLESIIAASLAIIFYPQTEQQAIKRLLMPWPQITAVAEYRLIAVDPNFTRTTPVHAFYRVQSKYVGI